MRVTVFNGSPLASGNTSALSSVLMAKLVERGAVVEEIMLFQKNLLGCNHCNRCRTGDLPMRCSIPDDMIHLYNKFLDSDLLIFASPIYMWNLTPCTLAFITRLHSLCRNPEGHNLMKGRNVALALTMGDETDVAKHAVGAISEFCEYFLINLRGELSVPFADRGKILAGECDGDADAFLDRILGQS
ncbi:MAG: flavodoxin family protein [Candidatus Methanoplasma sp.]|nr:flavodoxin family protein [Candidatus Methanoplasma sp.]